MLIGLFLQVERDKCNFLVEKVLAWVMASEIWTVEVGVGFLVANGNNRIERGCEVPRKWSQVIHNTYNQKGSNETMHRTKRLGDRLEK